MVGRVGDVVHCAEQITERLTGRGCALRHVPFLALATLSLIPNDEQWASLPSSTCGATAPIDAGIVNTSGLQCLKVSITQSKLPRSVAVCTCGQRFPGICIQARHGEQACAEKCAGK